MTAQITDTYKYLGEYYTLSATKGTGGFSPESYGFEPSGLTTAN